MLPFVKADHPLHRTAVAAITVLFPSCHHDGGSLEKKKAVLGAYGKSVARCTSIARRSRRYLKRVYFGAET